MKVPFLASQACGVCLCAQHQSVYLCKSLRPAGAASARRNQFSLTIHSLLSCVEPTLQITVYLKTFYDRNVTSFETIAISKTYQLLSVVSSVPC